MARDLPFKASVCIFLVALLVESASGFIISNPDIVPWTRTATGRRSENGQPATLTWSIVPDGTLVSDGLDDFGGSDLVDFLNENFDGDAEETDHTLQPWFPIIESSLNRWSELSGLTFEYEPNDDGGRHSNRRGVLGVRGDIRIAGAPIDGRSGTLAFNFFPESGGDMALDTDEVSFASSRRDFQLFRTTIMHEVGHGFGLSHVTSDTDSLLMDAFTDSAISGPQLDEVRGIQYFFGDAFEKTHDGAGNGTLSQATDLGELVVGGAVTIGADANVPSQRIGDDDTDFVSISPGGDLDFYSFTVPAFSSLSAELTPLGGVFSQAGDGGTPNSFDANARIDLSFSVFDSDGTTVLGFADDTFAGEVESLDSIELEPGTYYASVEGVEDSIQLYMLGLELTALDVVGDCNGDGIVNEADLACACGEGIDEVLTALGSRVGDLNLDGEVGFEDFLPLSAKFGETGDYLDGDLDCNGHIAFEDFLLLAEAFGGFFAGSFERTRTNDTDSVGHRCRRHIVATASLVTFGCVAYAADSYFGGQALSFGGCVASVAIRRPLQTTRTRP